LIHEPYFSDLIGTTYLTHLVHYIIPKELARPIVGQVLKCPIITYLDDWDFIQVGYQSQNPKHVYDRKLKNKK
jgi:hypothetical protein